MFLQPVYLKCDIMNNAGIVNRVDCACKLNRVSPETHNPLHALSGTHLCIDSDECCIPVVDTVILDDTLLGEVEISPLPSTSKTLNKRQFDIVPINHNFISNIKKKKKVFTCGFLRKKVSDKHVTNKNIVPMSDCICKNHRWKFPTIMQRAWKQNRRVRLKSNASLNNIPLQRYQSHHSSSDEDWFEEIADEETNNCNSNENKLPLKVDDCSSNFDNESDHVSTNKYKWCTFRKKFEKQPLTESKIDRRDPNNICRIL